MKNARYVVVEQSGNVGERDIITFDTNREAWDHIERNYDDDERDQFHKNCLYVDVRCDWTDDDGEEHSEYGC